MTLVDEIVAAMEALGGTAGYADLYNYIEKHARERVLRHSIRARIEEHSSDSRAYKGGPDIFYSAEGLGKGVWGLRSHLAPSAEATDIGEPDGEPLPSGRRQPPSVEARITRIIRDTAVSNQLKALYHYQCQVCDTGIELSNSLYAEAHHLWPLGRPHRGPDEANNIIVVCPNHHVEFDYGAIGIDPKQMTLIHVNPRSPFRGKQLRIHPLHSISQVSLAYHLDHVFKG